ncbi:MAG: hypothetical protein JWM31_1361 [Solirubrobacterales bacterium]|nr:hypothetical protein [Solirubrobacterales bacterium]
MTRLGRWAAALLAAGLLLGAASGCGTGGDGKGAQLLVTQDFGTRAIADLPQPKVTPDNSALDLLDANVDGVKRVTSAAGTERLVSAAGVAGGVVNGRPTAWSLFVNGVGADAKGPGAKLSDADVVWWDHHDTSAAGRVRAVVGSFPEPFRHGFGGKRLPLRIECSPADIPACQTAQDAMTAAGVFAAQGGLQQSITKETLRIIVGPWVRIRDDDTVKLLAGGPRASGVYARPAADAKSIAVLDGAGRTTRTLGPGDGLIAATRFQGDRPVWIVTGVDPDGVAAAAQAMDQGNLKDHFALAVADGRAVPVPEIGVSVRP